jgi:hypothetical protein
VYVIIESLPLRALALDEEHMRCRSQDARQQGKPMIRRDGRDAGTR